MSTFANSPRASTPLLDAAHQVEVRVEAVTQALAKYYSGPPGNPGGQERMKSELALLNIAYETYTAQFSRARLELPQEIRLRIQRGAAELAKRWSGETELLERVLNGLQKL